MPTIRRFVVVPAVPEKLQALTELANNLWTLWNYDASGLFRRLDSELWESTNHNPVRVLSLVSQEKLAAASSDEGFLSHMNRILADLRANFDTALLNARFAQLLANMTRDNQEKSRPPVLPAGCRR